MQVFNYYSIRTWLAISQEDTYIIDFPFLRREDIYVYVEETQLNSSDIEWLSDSQFKILATVLVNDKIVVRRFTKQDTRLVDYHDGSTLVENDLNLVTKQLLYLIQELTDYRTAGLDPGTIPVNPPDDGSGDPDFIDDIVNQIISTQTFQNLIALIELTDINAESIMQNSLSTHDRWSIQRLLDDTIEKHSINLEDYGIQLGTIDAQIIDINNTIITNESATATALDGIAVRFDTAEASVLTLQTAFANSESATATLTQQLQADIDSNNALILNVQSVLVDADSALAVDIDILNVSVTDAQSRIGTIEQAYVDSNGAQALIQTEIDLWYQDWYPNNDWESIISTSSYINGVETIVSSQGSDISGITSYLVGTLGTFENPADGTPMRSLANLQTTVDGHTDSLGAELDFRNAMFAYFNEDTNTGTALAAAMEQRWRVYADSESSIVSRTESLEVNQQPIFFRPIPPNHTDAEFIGSNFAANFPAGSTWHNTEIPTRLTSYYWHQSTSLPDGVPWSDIVAPSMANGMWVRMRDSDVETQGASILSLQTAYNNLGAVGGTIEDTIQAVMGDEISAISETMENWFNTDTGQMYAGWQVRINQYNGGTGTPVIAGIGLGMENDPANPEADSVSNFMVMADRFSIIRPPTSTELEGELTPDNVYIPFIVNTNAPAGEPDIVVNGDMFVRNTLSAMDGVAGRFTFALLDSAGRPVNEDGSRLIIASDTNDFNTAVGQSGSPWENGTTPQKYWIWAGDGDMNHNNAKFYIDTDGNAVFRGEVLADNVTGDISNIHSVDVTGGATASGTGWTVVCTSGTYSPSGNRERTPSIVVNVDMYGSGQTAGRARIEGRSKDDQGVWKAWEIVAEAPIYMPIGTTLTLAGTMAKTSGDVQLRSLIQRQEESAGDWQYPSSSYIKGVLQMLA